MKSLLRMTFLKQILLYTFGIGIIFITGINEIFAIETRKARVEEKASTDTWDTVLESIMWLLSNIF